MTVFKSTEGVVNRDGIHNFIEICVADFFGCFFNVIVEFGKGFVAQIMKVDGHHLIVGKFPGHRNMNILIFRDCSLDSLGVEFDMGIEPGGRFQALGYGLQHNCVDCNF